MQLYLVELIEYYYDNQVKNINQDEAKILGLYESEEEAKNKINLEIENYRKACKSGFDILRDEVLEENCIEALDLVSEKARVTIIGTRVKTGDSGVQIDYDRINYYFDYDKE